MAVQGGDPAAVGSESAEILPRCLGAVKHLGGFRHSGPVGCGQAPGWISTFGTGWVRSPISTFWTGWVRSSTWVDFDIRGRLGAVRHRGGFRAPGEKAPFFSPQRVAESARGARRRGRRLGKLGSRSGEGRRLMPSSVGRCRRRRRRRLKPPAERRPTSPAGCSPKLPPPSAETGRGNSCCGPAAAQLFAGVGGLSRGA